VATGRMRAAPAPGAAQIEPRVFLELMAGAAAILDEEGMVLEVNARFLEVTGRSRDEIVGALPPHSWWSLRGWDSGEIVPGEFDVEIVGTAGGRTLVRCIVAAVPPQPERRSRWIAIVLPSPDNDRDEADDDLARVVEAQAALVRVAREVARGARPDEIFTLVAREVASILQADAGLVLRFERDASVIVGMVGDHGADVGSRFPLVGEGAAVVAARTGRPARVDYRALPARDPTAERLVGHGYVSGVAAPVSVDGRLWGAVLATTTRERRLSADAEARLERFAEMVSLAIAGAQLREELATRASVDALTGVLNQGEFHSRFAIEAVRATRHGRPLALLVCDLDNFKHVNDTHGHQVGDRTLQLVARAIGAEMRAEDVLGRVGGEEFAVLLPEADAPTALDAAERVRAAVAGANEPGLPGMTVSVGVADLSDAPDPSGLFAAADHAMYYAKRSGRNRACRFLPEMRAPASTGGSDGVPAATIAGVRALALAVEARDPATSRHAERVADLSGRMGALLGWSSARIAELRQAALLHDVGKIGVPDTLLLKPGPLTAQEYEQVKPHAALGASILAEVIGPEQTLWVRHHHERYDGRGYPDGLAGAQIPEGACVIAVADAFDVMTSGRAYARPRTPEESLAEIRCVSGRQFSPRAVAALEGVLAEDVTRQERISAWAAASPAPSTT
jgi:diguanylate cyclase (GGDEF)-like protein